MRSLDALQIGAAVGASVVCVGLLWSVGVALSLAVAGAAGMAATVLFVASLIASRFERRAG
jgi:hypothetical protein